ncbi:lipoate protein ligase C-terminal domain-containing protein [Candidatus Undinarchaeota archaeon]
MEIKNDFKVAGGKLLRIAGSEAANKISRIAITGDFFMFPETGIEKIEQGLFGCEIDKEVIVEKTAEILRDNDIRVQGFTPEDLADAIIGGIQSEAASS